MLNSAYLLCYAALGAFAHWIILRYGRNWSINLEFFMADITGPEKTLTIATACTFSIMGAFLAFAAVVPDTNRQAVAAGMAWTTLFGGVTMKRPGKRKSDA